MFHLKKTFLFIFLIPASYLFGEDITVEGRFTPDKFPLNNSGLYQIIVNGTQANPTVELPSISGLNIRYIGPQKSIRVINGVTNSEAIYRFQVTAQKTGTYTLPAYTVELSGKNYPIEEAIVEITEATDPITQPSKSENLTPSDNQTPLLGLQVNLKNSNVYVGQQIPMALSFYKRRDIQVHNSAPRPTHSSDNFTTAHFSKEPHLEISNIEGSPYDIYTWQTTTTALKTGTEDLSFEFPVAVSLPQKRNAPRDPFEHFFGVRMTNTEQVTLKSPEVELHVQPLPEHAPSSFNGAIGSFQAKSNASAQSAQVGEPITYNVEITGEGNFDRISPPDLNFGGQWKSYPPKSEFSDRDGLGYRGKKTFEYILIAQSEKVTEIPQLEWSYFDPSSESYETVTTPAVPIDITPTPKDQTARKSYLPPIQSSEESNIPNTTQLLPIELLPGKWVQKITPLYQKRSFWTLQILALFGYMVFFIFRKRKLKLTKDPHLARLHQSAKRLRKHLNESEKAFKSQNIPEFYTSAQLAIQAALTPIKNGDTHSLTTTEIESLLDQKRVEPQMRQEVIHFFENADAIKFGGSSQPNTQIDKEFNRLKDVLSLIEKIGKQ